MTNYLISLRDTAPDKPPGTPGTGIGSTTYIEVADDATDYNLITNKTEQGKWLSDLAGSAVLVFVHGFGNGSDKVLVRHNAIKRHLGGSLVSFDWPSGNSGPLPRQAYDKDKANALATAPRLMGDCLQILLGRFTSGNVHLFAHSMGSYLTENAFQAPKAIKINHVMMAAADVDQLNYQAGSTPLTNFLGKCADLTAYWSADDEALKESQKWQSYLPLGLGGYKGSAIPGSCWGVQSTSYYEKYVRPSHPLPEFSHVWYLLFEPSAPAANDFYTDMGEILRGAPTTPTRGKTTDPRGFVLQRPA